jgi:hypothetical protein
MVIKRISEVKIRLFWAAVHLKFDGPAIRSFFFLLLSVQLSELPTDDYFNIVGHSTGYNIDLPW